MYGFGAEAARPPRGPQASEHPAGLDWFFDRLENSYLWATQTYRRIVEANH